MRKGNKLLWTSIAIIIIVDIISYFTANTTERNPSINIPLFIVFVFGVLLLLFSLKDFIMKNVKGSIIGFFLGLIIGIASLGLAASPLIFLLPIFALMQNIIGCAGEDCWFLLIISSSIFLALIGLVIGAYIQNKKSNKKWLPSKTGGKGWLCYS